MQLTYVEGFFIKFLEFLFILINYNLGQWSIQISLWISQTIVLLIKCNYQFPNYESWMFTKRFMNDPFLTSTDRLILWCTSLYCMYYIIFTQHMIFFFQTKDREEEKWKSLTSMQWRIDQNSEVMPKWFELVNRWLELCPHALSCALFKKELWPTYQHLDFKTHCTIISEIVS